MHSFSIESTSISLSVYAYVRDKINRELYEKNVISGPDVAVEQYE
jgi:hypothetical protein